MELGGRPIVAWSLAAFGEAASVTDVVIAAPPDLDPGAFEEWIPGSLAGTVVAGGATRTESVARALAEVETNLVAVHDAARPLVTVELIEALVARLRDHADAAGVIAATALTDTVKRVGDDGRIAATEPREALWRAQTPQVFRTEVLREAHAAAIDRAAGATDDSMLVEATGGEVLIEPAPAENLKVTTAVDLRLAELLLAERATRAPG